MKEQCEHSRPHGIAPEWKVTPEVRMMRTMGPNMFGPFAHITHREGEPWQWTLASDSTQSDGEEGTAEAASEAVDKAWERHKEIARKRNAVITT